MSSDPRPASAAMTNDLERATVLIVEIHQFFTDWVSGRCLKDKALFAGKAKNHLSSGFLGIMPNGWSFDPGVFDKSMWEAHGKSPKFRIEIRDVQVRHRIGNALVVTYEEWAHDAVDAPHDNARLSTMVLRDLGDKFEIVHLQETWLPADVVKAGSFAF